MKWPCYSEGKTAKAKEKYSTMPEHTVNSSLAWITNDNKREREINNSQQLITPRVLLDGYVIMLANMNHWSCRKITSLFNVSIVWHYELEEMTLKCVDDLLNHEGDLNHAPSDESSSSRMATQCSAGRDYESSCQMEGGCSPNINLQIFFCDH